MVTEADWLLKYIILKLTGALILFVVDSKW